MTSQELSIIDNDLVRVCRLCMSKSVTTVNVFRFSNRFQSNVADIIMKCAPVQILRCDEMPKYICQLCYIQLEKTHQFQIQIIQADTKLRCYLQQKDAPNKNPTLECSLQRPFEKPLIEICDNFNLICKINKTVPLTSKIKIEQTNYSINPPNYADGTIETKSGDYSDSIINKKQSETPTFFNTGCQNIEEIYIKSEIKNEPIDDESSPPTVNIANASSNYCGSEVIYEDVNIGTDVTSANSVNVRSTDAEKKIEKRKKKKVSIADTQSAHKRRHTGEKPYHCKICNKCFVNSDGLQNHMRAHSGEKPNQCEICNKDFASYRNLVNHKRTHTGDRPYRCDICDKCFAQSVHLINHKRRHTGEKPYQCSICSKCFVIADGLKNHMRIHTGEKPYQCDICNMNFAYYNNLKSHKRLHTGEKPYQCDNCDKCFTQSCSLKFHKRVHKGEKPDKYGV